MIYRVPFQALAVISLQAPLNRNGAADLKLP